MGLRKLSPGGHEYLTNAVACHDRELEPGELLSDYYLSHGYPAGQWFGAGAETLGLSGAVTAAQMQALFGEGRNPHADAIEAEMIADGHTAADAIAATKLGRSFPKYSALDHMRSKTAQAYKDHNVANGRPIGAPIDTATRAQLRHGVQIQAYTADQGQPPGDDKELREWLAEQKKTLKSAVSGFEVVFAPDKSVSIAWALAGPQEREQIANLVRQAARDTVSYIEQNLAFTRRGAMGEAQVDVTGITVALFEHWDSRASDPHLHFHGIISSKVQRADDLQWTALDGRTILAGGVTASQFFDSRTRDLFREAGAQWTQRAPEGIGMTRPIWQLAAVPHTLIKGFSQRHRQFETVRAKRIVEFRATHGREPSPKDIFAIDKQAQYDNRPGKRAAKTLSEHRLVWREYAERLVHPEQLRLLGQRLFTGRTTATQAPDVAGLAVKTRAVVSDNYAHFTRWNLESEAHTHTAHLTVAPTHRQKLITDIVDTILTAPDTLSLQGPALVQPAPFMRRRDGQSVFDEHNSTRYTTTQTLAEEGDLVAWARRRGGHRLRTDTVDTALAGAKLNAGQRRMVTEFARSGRRLQLALAPAGAGKTSAMKVFADAWRRTGTEVYAFGPSARAAQELGASIGARPHTLHQLTTAKKLGFAHRAFPIQPGDMVIIDEAAMSGTHTLHAVVTYALTRGADVRLIGDDKQLAAVEAGGAIRLIAHDVGALRFTEIVRFRGPDRKEQAEASLLIRDGNVAGLKYYDESGRIQGGSLETMRDAAHHAWRADLDNGVQSLLIVPTNEDTVALNIEARELRRHRGELGGGRQAELHDGTRAERGDWVVTRHNQRLLSLFGGRDFVKNGDIWNVVAVHDSGRILVQHRLHGGRVTLPARYATTHVELAYASTVNRVQGMTSTGNAHLLVPPTMTREQFYPAVTRAMLRNVMYVVTHHHVIDQHRETPHPQEPLEVLTGVLHHSGAEISATEEMRNSLGIAESLGTLVKQYNYAATYLDDHRYQHVLRRYAPETLDRDSEPALIQTLRNANDLGWHADQLVSDALAHSTLTGADDPGAVLHTRITTYIDGRTPPPGADQPRTHDITRWRGIIDAISPGSNVEDAVWEPVWRRAAGGLATGFHIDAAMTLVAHQLAGQASNDPLPHHRYADNLLAAELAARGDRGEAHVRAVPWLARPDFAVARGYPGNAEFLHRANEAISNRVNELRAGVIRDQPAWAASLGPRPANPVVAEEWDAVAGLAAGYRETFNIVGDDIDEPLGAEPATHGAKAHSWRHITERWNALTGTMPPVTTAPAGPDSTDDLHAGLPSEFTIEDVYAAVDDEPAVETLDVLVRRHDLVARAGDDERFLDLLARHVPEAVNTAAEPAVIATLRRAQDAGWQAERLLATSTQGKDFTWADNPAAALTAHLNRYITSHQPPAKTAPADETDIRRWRDIVTEHLPGAAVTSEQWDVVWRHAAGGTTTGLDTDRALEHAVESLAADTSGDTDGDQLLAGHALVAELTRQYRAGQGHHPALPWLATADHGHTDGDYERRHDELERLNAAVRDRATHLRDHAAIDTPGWAARAGQRPDDAVRARRWDDVVGLAAAYRETYRVRTTDASSPLGDRPTGNGPKAQAWQHIAEQWRQLMTTPDREDAASATFLAEEARRDIQDTLSAEFASGVAARTAQRHEEEEAVEAARRDDTDAEFDDMDYGRDEGMQSGFGY